MEAAKGEMERFRRMNLEYWDTIPGLAYKRFTPETDQMLRNDQVAGR